MIRIATIAGPWFSLGLHCHFWPPSKSHIDLHFLWWIVTVGPYAYYIKELERELREAGP